MRQSIIYSYSVDEIRSFIDTSNTIHEVLQKIGFRSTNGSGCRQVFFNYIKEHNLSIDNLKERTKEQRRKQLKSLHSLTESSFEDCFCENSQISRHAVKTKIIKYDLLPYKCDICGNNGSWNGLPLSLQLDHINGISNDNRLENLRFLCPNCHSQTETYAGKHNSENKNKDENNKKDFIRSNLNTELEKERWILIEESNIDFSKFGWVGELSKLFGVSPNKAGNYVKIHYPEFYKKCFIRK
jgi:5-methylcytosine-specific restriction endonuclease McrA